MKERGGVSKEKRNNGDSGVGRKVDWGTWGSVNLGLGIERFGHRDRDRHSQNGVEEKRWISNRDGLIVCLEVAEF